ncbi:hypothetical protein MiSe_41370 [Microseira wollei NIES-4236]|uniref:Transposase n=1 Tax=Microseira wollei NIES-4236 TaxID=2530354 RepID=A0AAV3XAA0_9CYAN|nr:hypothetical protein [Microseira wollei]GET39368.1 hypothetical protein MiSe_41370 [Microseira wollei NIES-4236]
MTTLTYCKGLPTPLDELNPAGYTQFECLMTAFSQVFYRATILTVNHLLNQDTKFNKSSWNTHLQQTYGISKRHANGVIALSIGVEAASRSRTNQLKQLESKLSFAKEWLSQAQNQIKIAQFSRKKNWPYSKNGCNFPLATRLEPRKNNWDQTKFNIHHKPRYIYKITRAIAARKSAPIKVKVRHCEGFIVGAKDESYGNQTCQWDGNNLKFRVPYCLEDKLGKFVS